MTMTPTENLPTTEHRAALVSWLTGRAGVGVFAVAAVVLVAFLAVRLTKVLAVTPAVANRPVPTVSVTEIGISKVPTTVSIIGTIGARYDMPIGVEDAAGRVAAILVEAGDHVKRGQVLARLNVSILEPQGANLEAALAQAPPNPCPPFPTSQTT